MLLTALAVCAQLTEAQTIQFPRSGPPAASLPPTLNTPGSFSTTPGATTPINPYTGNAAAAPFDPYSPSGSAAYQFWSTTPPSNAGGVFGQPPVSPYGATTPLAPPATSPPTFGPPLPSATAPPQYVFPSGAAQQFDLTQ